MTKQIFWSAFWKTVLVVIAIGDVLTVLHMDFEGPVGLFKLWCARLSLLGMLVMIALYFFFDYFNKPHRHEA
jgi:hypothetical protein